MNVMCKFNLTVSILFSILCVMTSCKEVTEKKLNNDDFAKVKELINASDTLSSGKKRYLIDNLTMLLGLSEIGKAVNPDIVDSIPTFKKQISLLSVTYDKKKNEIESGVKNNQQLRELLMLTGAEAVPIDRYNGYLKMNFTCKNEFSKPILYALISYRYVNKYDSEFFDEKAKLTDEAAGNFKNGDLPVMTTEKFNEVSEFMYTKVPQTGNKEFMMEGLKVDVLGVVFTDKSEVTLTDTKWEYLN